MLPFRIITLKLSANTLSSSDTCMAKYKHSHELVIHLDVLLKLGHSKKYIHVEQIKHYAPLNYKTDAGY